MEVESYHLKLVLEAGTTLADQTDLFVAKISDSLIGLSTVKVGLGTTGVFVELVAQSVIPELYSSVVLEQEYIIAENQSHSHYW